MSSTIMQNCTFITFIVSENCDTEAFAMLDNHPADQPNTDHYILTFFM